MTRFHRSLRLTLRRPQVRRAACGIVLGVWALALSACQEPLFVKDEPRSQYDRSAAIRDRRAPDYLFDEFGARRANIRGRLLGAE